MGTVFQALVDERTRLMALGTPLADVIRVLSFDKASTEMPEAGLSVQAADPAVREHGMGAFYAHIYDDYHWNVVLHPNSVTSPHQDPESLRRMFHLECEGVVGELAFVHDYFRKHGPAARNPGVEHEISRLFAPAIDAVPSNSIVHWSMHSIMPLMGEKADSLRERGVYQTYHHHFPESERLHETPEGRAALIAQSKVDALYFHTDEDVRAFHAQAEALRLRIPQHVGRFDLGIDTVALKSDAQRIHRDSYTREIRTFHSLNESQREILKSVAQADAQKIPHQFTCIDRIDAHKGIAVLLDGIEQYLRSLNISLESMQKQYRFFFFHELFGLTEFDDNRLKHQYQKYVQEKYAVLQEEFPGVINVSGSIPRDAVAWVVNGRTLLNASPHDGKNLAVMEGAYVNSINDEGDAGVIMGSGTGFAVQLKEWGLDDLVSVAQAGDKNSVAACIRSVVTSQVQQPGKLRKGVRELVEKAILPQHDTLFPDPITVTA